VEAEAPELAALARGFLGAHIHETLATLRRDGSSRISGTEVNFADGELWLGSMWRSLKALDLLRDPRFALHSGLADSPDWTGDAKPAGRADEVTDPERKAAIIGADGPSGPSHLFCADSPSSSLSASETSPTTSSSRLGTRVVALPVASAVKGRCPGTRQMRTAAP
jgi:hypothetical protein